MKKRIKKSGRRPARRPSKRPAGGPGKRPGKRPVRMPARRSANRSAKKPAKKPAFGREKKPAKKPSSRPVKRLSRIIKKPSGAEKLPMSSSGIRIEIGARITEPGSSVRNKTGSWRVMRPVKDPSRCTGCGFCWMFCPDIAISEDFEINYDYCKGCGICVMQCPFGALHMEKEEK